jgi:S1-C subfamily serine protease
MNDLNAGARSYGKYLQLRRTHYDDAFCRFQHRQANSGVNTVFQTFIGIPLKEANPRKVDAQLTEKKHRRRRLIAVALNHVRLQAREQPADVSQYKWIKGSSVAYDMTLDGVITRVVGKTLRSSWPVQQKNRQCNVRFGQTGG